MKDNWKLEMKQKMLSVEPFRIKYDATEFNKRLKRQEFLWGVLYPSIIISLAITILITLIRIRISL